MKKNTRFDQKGMLQAARRRRQSGELSMIEAGGVLAAAALLALAVTAGGKYVMDRVSASHFRSEAHLFHSGVLDATSSDTDFSGETLQTLIQNHAFDAAGARVVGNSTLTAMFGGTVTAAPSTLSSPNDVMVITYPVPSTVCSLSVAALTTDYTQVVVNGTVVAGPLTTFNDSTAATACASAGNTANIDMYATRN
jgi:PilS N terminal